MTFMKGEKYKQRAQVQQWKGHGEALGHGWRLLEDRKLEITEVGRTTAGSHQQLPFPSAACSGCFSERHYPLATLPILLAWILSNSEVRLGQTERPARV